MSILFENDIAVATAVKNESTYIGEWLEYHYKIGVDKFYVYNNDSEDRSELEKVLEPWIQKNVVEYFQLPGLLSQIPAYIDAIKRFRFDCKYLGFIDCDEFNMCMSVADHCISAVAAVAAFLRGGGDGSVVFMLIGECSVRMVICIESLVVCWKDLLGGCQMTLKATRI